MENANIKFNCICDKKLTYINELKKHYSECEIMQMTYQELLKPFEQMTSQAEEPDQLKKLHGLVNVVQEKIKERLQELNLVDCNKTQNAQQTRIEFENIQLDNEENKEQKVEESKQIPLEKCKYCEEDITQEDEKEQRAVMLQSTECFHLLHSWCLKKIATKATRRQEPIRCPDENCRMIIHEYELKEALGQKVMDEIEQLARARLLADNPNFVNCSCGNIMEVVEGEVNFNIKTPKGQLLSRESAIHLAKYRVRCNQCNKNFCSLCQAQPYHITRTCEEFKEFKEAEPCRFCKEKCIGPPPSVKPAFRFVCRAQKCIETMGRTCDKVLTCGHPCNGISGEMECCPCLYPECVQKYHKIGVDEIQDMNSICKICGDKKLGAEPCIQLTCTHIYHYACIFNQIANKQEGAKITFEYLKCLECKQFIDAPLCADINLIMYEEKQTYNYIKRKSVERAKIMGLDKNNARLNNPADKFYNDLPEYAMHYLTFYECFKCKVPFFGGFVNMEDEQRVVKQYNPEELLCGFCCHKQEKYEYTCQKHGREFLQYKCKLCCSLASWYYNFNSHYCEYHYLNPHLKPDICRPEYCDLKGIHKYNGNEDFLGCLMCQQDYKFYDYDYQYYDYDEWKALNFAKRYPNDFNNRKQKHKNKIKKYKR